MGSRQFDQEPIKQRGRLGKTLTPLDKQLNSVKWGEYRLGDLFDIQSTSSFNTDRLTKGEEYDYITRTSLNQGILQSTGFVNKENINPAGTWSLGLLQMDFFYRNKPWYAGQFVRKIVPTIDIPEGAILFFQTLLNLQKSSLLQVLVRNVDETFRNAIILLPQTEDKEIDFGFMESFIHELEGERLHKLETYMLVTGLNDYHLTSDDHSALNCFKELRWQEFKIGDLFERITTKKLPYKAKDLPQQPIGQHTLPCLTSSFMNQGLNYYAPRDGATILNNVISIPSNSDVYRAYYQSNDFTVLSDAYAICWKDKSIDIQSKPYLFMVACINKVTDLSIYSYKNKLGGWNVVKDKYIVLPATVDNQPDLVAMERLIAAIQKIVIADVAKYTSRRLEAARQIVESKPVPYDTNVVSDYWMAAEPFECYKWSRFDQSIIDFFGGDKTILVGCYKGKKHLEWILAHNTYNIRLGRTKGSMEEKRNLFGKASLLVLYEQGKPNKLSAYKIISHREIDKEELQEMNYPKKNPRKSYLAFSIVPFEMDLSFLIEHHLIDRLVELNADNAKGTPVFIEP